MGVTHCNEGFRRPAFADSLVFLRVLGGSCASVRFDFAILLLAPPFTLNALNRLLYCCLIIDVTGDELRLCFGVGRWLREASPRC